MVAFYRKTAFDGIKLAVYDYCRHGGKSTTNVLFSHGTGFHGRVFDSVANSLQNNVGSSGSLVNMMSFDHRGHGKSEWNHGSGLNWAQFGEDVLSVSEGFVPESKVIGVGHSMGACALIIAALKYPQRFAGLVLYEPVVYSPAWRDMYTPAVDGEDSLMGKMARKRKYKFASLESAYNNFRMKPPMSAFDEAVLHDYVNFGMASDNSDETKNEARVYLQCHPDFEAMVYNTAPLDHTWNELDTFHSKAANIPIVLIHGRIEEGQPSDLSSGIAERIGNQCEVIAWPECGHFGPMEQPHRFAEMIAAFITRFR